VQFLYTLVVFLQFSNEKFLQEQNTRLEIKCNNLEQQLRALRGPASRPDNQVRWDSQVGQLGEIIRWDSQVG